MLRNIDYKKTVVSDIKKIAEGSASLVAVNYSGMTVAEMTDLRNKARKVGVRVNVVRNTLAKRAFDGTSFACISTQLVGQLLFAFSKESDPGVAARLIKDEAKNNEKMKVVACVVDGELLLSDRFNELAEMPTFDKSIEKMVRILNAPVYSVVRTLSETYAQLVRVLNKVSERVEG